MLLSAPPETRRLLRFLQLWHLEMPAITAVA